MLPTKKKDSIVTLHRMLDGLTFINQSTTITSSTVKQQLQQEYRLSETTLKQIVATLENDYHQDQITALQNEAKKREGWVGYYIKTTTNETGVSKSKEDHINITVMLNHQGHLQVVVKPEGERKEEVAYNEGTIKRATNETMIFFDQEGTLRVNNVVDIKGKPEVQRKLAEEERRAKNISISGEVIEHDPNAFTCFFPDAGVVQGGKKRAGDIRIYQTYKGKDLIDDMGENGVDVDYAMQYMLQIGAQLSELHKKGISHHDVKLENILSRQVDEHRVVALIDCPRRGETASPSGVHGTRTPTVTPGASCPPRFWEGTYYWSNDVYKKRERREKDAIDEIWITQRDGKTSVAKSYWESSKAYTGHVDDSYAYLRGLYKIADSIPRYGILGGPNPGKVLLQKFALAQMQELANQTRKYVDASENSWPEENLTVASIQQAFAEYCENNLSLQTAFSKAKVTAKQAGSGAVAGFQITIPEEKDGKRVVGNGNRGGRRGDRRNASRPGDKERKTRPTVGVGANQPQPADTVAMVLKEQRDRNSLRWLWLLFLDCVTLRFGEGSRRTLYKNMYSAFHLRKDAQQPQVDFGWKLIAQSLENKRFETGCVEFAQALIVAEVLSSANGGEIKEDVIASTISDKVSGLTGPNKDSFTSKLNDVGSKKMILSAAQAITAAKGNGLDLTQEADVVKSLREAAQKNKKS